MELPLFLWQAEQDGRAGPPSTVDEQLFEAIREHRSHTADELKELRSVKINEVMRLHRETYFDNVELISKSPEHVQMVLHRSGINVILLQKLMEQYGCQDAELIDFLLQGFPNEGPVPTTGCLERETRQRFLCPSPKKRRKYVYVKHGRPRFQSEEDLSLMERHFEQMLQQYCAKEVEVVESDLSEEYFPEWPFVRRATGKKPRAFDCTTESLTCLFSKVVTGFVVG